MTTHIPTSSSSGLVGMRPMQEDGENFVYALLGPPPGTPSGAAFGNGISRRGALSWLDTSIGFPYNIESTSLFVVLAPSSSTSFSEDLQSALWIASVPLTPDGPPEGETGIYSEKNGVLQFVAPIGPLRVFSYAGFANISSDGSRIVFATAKHLLPADAGRTGGDSIYAWANGNLQLVDVNQGGSLLSTCGAEISKANGVSTSGNRAFFSVPASCNGVEKVYLRDLKNGTTVQISASKCTRLDCNADADVTYAGATRGGEVAFMTTTQQLTNDDEDSLRDLYSYDVQSGELTLRSGGDAAATGEVKKAVAFPSEVGGRVYFGASGELLPGESGVGDKLFLADGNGVHFVAEAGIPTFAEEQQIQLSRDGRRALFVTPAKLRPGDTDEQADAYLYDDDKAELTRISTGSAGGNGAFPVIITAPSPVNQHEFETGNRRPYYAIDAAGEHTFLQTEEALLPEDTNGKSDVYEYWQGNLSMVSAGDLAFRSDFAGISRDGRSVMFATNATLVPYDLDGGSRDLYNARLGSGFPAVTDPAPCDSASCPLPTRPRLTRGVPPSTFPSAKKSEQLRLLEVASKAKKGAISVSVSAPGPGLVTGSVWTRQNGKKVVLARGSKRATSAGKVDLVLQLQPAARSAPAVIPKAHLTVSSGKAQVSRVIKVKLR